MTLSRSRLLVALLSLLIVASGCDLMGSSQSATPTPSPVFPRPSGEATRRPRHTPRPEVSLDPSTSAQPTPRRTRKPRPLASPSGEPSPTPVPTPKPTPMPPIPGFDQISGTDGRFTILLLGSDARGKVVGERTDTIMVATIDPGTGRVAMASLPRDTVNVPIADGQVYASPSRINGLLQSFEFNGATREQALNKVTKAMEYAFGTEIDAYVVIGFNGVRSLIDQIGGVDVFMDRPLWDPSMHVTKKGLKLKAGINHLDGPLALAFARTRHTDSDYQRAGRQQQLIMAAASKVLSNGLDSVPALAALVMKHVETNLPLSALPVLVELATRAHLKNYKSVVLGPSTYAGDGPETYTIEMKLDAVRAMFDRLFGPV